MLATLRKEFLLIIKDFGGLLLMLIMPTALVIVMAVSKAPSSNDFAHQHFKLLVVNNDNGIVGHKMIIALKESGHFTPITQIDNNKLTDSFAAALVHKGTYKHALSIPNKTTASIVNATNEVANMMSGSGSFSFLPTNKDLDTIGLTLLNDPAAEPVENHAIQSILNAYIGKVKLEQLMTHLSDMGESAKINPAHFSLDNLMGLLAVKGQTSFDASEPSLKAQQNVQRNVIIWAIFGMFMIVVPIAANLIKERDEGSDVRIRLIPNAALPVAIGKTIFYILVCLGQFICMLLIGIFVLPLFGLPSMLLGHHYFALLIMALSICVAAVGYSFFIGNLLQTENQAMPFGAISVVLLAALGGLWFPIDTFPPLMRTVSAFSPINWCVKGLNEVILRDNGFLKIIPFVLALWSFGIIFPFIGFSLRKKR